MGYSFRLAACFLYASSHRQDNTYHSICYTNRGAPILSRKRGMIFNMRRETVFQVKARRVANHKASNSAPLIAFITRNTFHFGTTEGLSTVTCKDFNKDQIQTNITASTLFKCGKNGCSMTFHCLNLMNE